MLATIPPSKWAVTVAMGPLAMGPPQVVGPLPHSHPNAKVRHAKTCCSVEARGVIAERAVPTAMMIRRGFLSVREK